MFPAFAGTGSCRKTGIHFSGHAPINTRASRSVRQSVSEAVADAVERLDHVERGVDAAELLADALDVAVDGAVIDANLVVVGDVHQRVAALDHPRTADQRLHDLEFGDRQYHGPAFPSAQMAVRVEADVAALDRARLGL